MILFSLLIPASASALSFTLPPGDVDVIGQVQRIQAQGEDTLIDIGRRYGVGYEEMVSANPTLDPWLPSAGAEVIVPTRYILPAGPREGVVLNLAELRLYYYPRPKPGQVPQVETYPVGIGRGEWQTPVGGTRIAAKVENPNWYPPASVRQEAEAAGKTIPRVVPPGPDNPLGRFAMTLDLPGYVIHSTNRPWGVGMRVSHGCVRMYPEDIEQLIFRMAVGTDVRIIDQPVKTGWLAGELFVEVHRPLQEEGERPDEAGIHRHAVQEIALSLGPRSYRVDGHSVRRALSESRGVPVRVKRQHVPARNPATQ